MASSPRPAQATTPAAEAHSPARPEPRTTEEVPDSSIDPILRNLSNSNPQPEQAEQEEEGRSSRRRRSSLIDKDYEFTGLTSETDESDNDGGDEFRLSDLDEEEPDSSHADEWIEDRNCRQSSRDSNVSSSNRKRQLSNQSQRRPHQNGKHSQNRAQFQQFQQQHNRTEPSNGSDRLKPIPTQRRRLMEIGALGPQRKSDRRSRREYVTFDDSMRAKSCENCRQRKQRCSSHETCSNCVLRNEKCIWKYGVPLYKNHQIAPASHSAISHHRPRARPHDSRARPSGIPRPVARPPPPPPPTQLPPLPTTSDAPSLPQPSPAPQPQAPSPALAVPPPPTYVRFPSQTYAALMVELSRLTRLTDILTKRWTSRENTLAKAEGREARRCISLLDLKFIEESQRAKQRAKGPSSSPEDLAPSVGDQALRENGEVETERAREMERDENGDILVGEIEVEKDQNEPSAEGGGGGATSTKPTRPNRSASRTSTSARQTTDFEDAAILLTLSQPRSVSHSPQEVTPRPLPTVNKPQGPRSSVEMPPPQRKQGTKRLPPPTFSPTLLAKVQAAQNSVNPGSTLVPSNQRTQPKTKRPRFEKNVHHLGRSFYGTDHSLLLPHQIPNGFRPILSRGYGKDANGRDLPPDIVEPQPEPFNPFALPVPPPAFHKNRPPRIPAPAPTTAHRPSKPRHFDPYPKKSASSFTTPSPYHNFQPPPANISHNLVAPHKTFLRPEPAMPVRPPPALPVRVATVNPRDFLPPPKATTSNPPLPKPATPQPSSSKSLSSEPSTSKASHANDSTSKPSSPSSTSTSGKKRSHSEISIPAGYLPLVGARNASLASRSKAATTPVMHPPSPQVFFPMIPLPSLPEQEKTKLMNDRTVDRVRRVQREYREKRRKWHEMRFTNLVKGKGRLVPAPATKKRKIDNNPVRSASIVSQGHGARRTHQPVQQQNKTTRPPKSLAAQAAETWATLNAVNERQKLEKAKEKERARAREKNQLPPIVMPVTPYHQADSKFKGTQDPMLGVGPLAAGADLGDTMLGGGGSNKSPRIGTSPRQGHEGFGRRSSHWSPTMISPLLASTSPSNSHSTLPSLLPNSSISRDDSLPSLSSVFDPLPPSTSAFSSIDRHRTPPPLTPSTSINRLLLESPSRSFTMHDFDQASIDTNSLENGIGGQVIDAGADTEKETMSYDAFQPSAESTSTVREALAFKDLRPLNQVESEGRLAEVQESWMNRNQDGQSLADLAWAQKERMEEGEIEEKGGAQKPNGNMDAALAALEHVRDG